MGTKKTAVNILYSQLAEIKEDWEERQKNGNVIFHTELSQYNTLLEKARESLSDPDICDYEISDASLSSSVQGNKYIYPTTALFQIRNLKKCLEGKYKISAAEATFIKDKFLKDKYLLYLFDRKHNSASDVLATITLEFEDRLRRKASLPESSTGTDLANQALNPKTGKLFLRNRLPKESEGYYNLVKGFFSFVRGKPHHVRDELGRAALLREVLLIDKLLTEFDNLEARTYEAATTTTAPDQGE